jgi:hypothetical protein
MPHVLPQLAEHSRGSSTHCLGYPADRLTALDASEYLLSFAD